MRRYVIGDIHGCSKALRTLLETIEPETTDQFVFLGDYVDRGPDSKDVVEQILQLRKKCRVVALRGNHEIMLLGVLLGGLDDSIWLGNGGQATVTSYGGCLSKMPDDHLDFFQQLLPYHESTDTIFVHAGYHHLLPMDQLDDATTYWNHLPAPLPLPHHSGKRVFLGHTPQPAGNVLDAGHVVCLDTYCFGGGYLTAYEIGDNQIIQADRHGHLRRIPLQVAAQRLERIGRAVFGFCRDQFGQRRERQTQQQAEPEPTEPDLSRQN